MAKIRGPLFSVAAAGSIGKKLTFRATRRGAVAQRHSAPTGAPTALQAEAHQLFRTAAQRWQALTQEELDHWLTAAMQHGISARHLFTREYCIQRPPEGEPVLIPAR